MSSFFDKPELWHNIPAILSNEIEEMMYEREHSGIETTPDETSNVIEAFYKFIARIWILEAIHIEKNKPEIFTKISGENFLRFIYDLLSNYRNPTIGGLVSSSRRIRNFFIREDIQPFTNGLLSLDFGQSYEDKNPTSTLLEFRNHFAHGAFHADKETVQKHYQILASCLENISGIYSQRFVAYKDGSWYHCAKTITKIDALPIQLEEGVYLLGEDNTYLSLQGMFAFSGEELGITVATHVSAEEILASEQMEAFIKRYIKEKNGEIYLEEYFQDPDGHPLRAEVKTQIQTELQKPNNACIIEAYPGTDVQNILHHQKELSESFDAYFIWNIKTNDITMSGYTFMYKIMRIIESIIPEASSITQEKDILKTFDAYLDMLEDKEKTVCIFIHNIHIGLKQYRTEKILLIDVYNRLIERNFTILASIYPAQIRKGFFYDSLIQYPSDISYPNKVKTYIQECLKDEIQKNILLALKNKPNLHLFEICDSIDQSKNENITFEPEIEYALWNIAAILSTKKEEKTIEEETSLVRVWSLFDQSIMEYIQ